MQSLLDSLKTALIEEAEWKRNYC